MYTECMSNTIYMVTNDHGDCLADGLEPHAARKIAQSMATRLKQRVWLSERDEESTIESFVPEKTEQS